MVTVSYRSLPKVSAHSFTLPEELHVCVFTHVLVCVCMHKHTRRRTHTQEASVCIETLMHAHIHLHKHARTQNTHTLVYTWENAQAAMVPLARAGDLEDRRGSAAALCLLLRGRGDFLEPS